MSEDVHLLPSEALSAKVHGQIADLCQGLIDLADSWRAGLELLADALELELPPATDTAALAKIRARAAEPAAFEQIAEIRASMEAARAAGRKSLKYPDMPRNDGSHAPAVVDDGFPEVERQNFLAAQGGRYGQIAAHAKMASDPKRWAAHKAHQQAYEEARAEDRRRAGLGGRS
jgi:hypothetical protein